MRAKKTPIRETKPDLKYNSVKITKLINGVMRDGKKTVAQKQVYDGLELAAKQLNKKPVEIVEEVLRTISPQMEVRSRRVGGAAYQVPMPVRGRRGVSLSIRWLVEEANKRSSKQYHSFAEKLAAEMIDAVNNAGGAVGKRDAAHRMAETNKAFAHFRW
jgi:small subunit ribosomal protein S7